jgi:hypothetical protein
MSRLLWMPTERLPTSEFQRKDPGAKIPPAISVQPVGSTKITNMSRPNGSPAV